MNKLDYFIYSIKNENYRHRKWLLCVFAIIGDGTDNEFLKLDGKKLSAKIKKDGAETLVTIEDYKAGAPLYGKNEFCVIPKNCIGFIEQNMKSTYGIFIINALLLWYPYQGKAKYINGVLTPKLLNGLAYDLLKNDKASVEEHRKFENACNMISCLTQTGVPSASRKSITPNPKIPALKKKLLTENKDNMNDPTTIVKVMDQLIAADKEYLKGDPSEKFFSKKNWTVTRLKTMGMYGAEPDFYDESKLSVMETSLNEGWTKNNLPMLINNLRSGAYARGKETALGGESTKITSRIFQNYKVEVDDCLTTIGLLIPINEMNYKIYVGRYVPGRKDPLTVKELEAAAKKGDILEIRSPAFCKSNGSSFCKKCMGDQVNESGLGLNSQTITATSTFMSVAMAATHSKQLTVGRYSYKDRIR